MILSDNKLEVLPQSIGELEKLEGLYLSGNKLNSLPQNIVKLKKLKYLSLLENEKLVLSDEQKYWIEELKNSGCRILI